MDCKSVLSELHSGELIVFVDDAVYVSYDCDVIKIDIQKTNRDYDGVYVSNDSVVN